MYWKLLTEDRVIRCCSFLPTNCYRLEPRPESNMTVAEHSYRFIARKVEIFVYEMGM